MDGQSSESDGGVRFRRLIVCEKDGVHVLYRVLMNLRACVDDEYRVHIREAIDRFSTLIWASTLAISCRSVQIEVSQFSKLDTVLLVFS